MEFFIIYKPSTLEELSRNSGPEGNHLVQPLYEDRGVVLVNQSTFQEMTPLLDIDPTELRDSLWAFTKHIRSGIAVRGAATSWGVVDSEPLALQNLQLKAGVAMFQKHQGDSTPLSFTLKDNSVVPLTPDETLVFVGQAVSFVDSVYDYARQLRIALDAAQTAAEVLAVDIFRGWPSAT